MKKIGNIRKIPKKRFLTTPKKIVLEPLREMDASRFVLEWLQDFVLEPLKYIIIYMVAVRMIFVPGFCSSKNNLLQLR
jgi:hypothetical protein